MPVSQNHAFEVARPVRLGSRPFASKGPELVEGLDLKPLNGSATAGKRVEVKSLHFPVTPF
jgi:hypothetical protein